MKVHKYDGYGKFYCAGVKSMFKKANADMCDSHTWFQFLESFSPLMDRAVRGAENGSNRDSSEAARSSSTSACQLSLSFFNF
jgi:hypothetical protein